MKQIFLILLLTAPFVLFGQTAVDNAQIFKEDFENLILKYDSDFASKYATIEIKLCDKCPDKDCKRCPKIMELAVDENQKKIRTALDSKEISIYLVDKEGNKELFTENLVLRQNEKMRLDLKNFSVDE